MSSKSAPSSVTDRILWVIGIIVMVAIVVVALAGVIFATSGPAEPRVHLAATHQRTDGKTDVAIEVRNAGGETAADVHVLATWHDQEFDADVIFLAPDQMATVHVVVPGDAKRADIKLDVLGWSEP